MPVCKLGGEDASSIAASAHGLMRVEQGLVDHPGWVAAARTQWEDLPGGIRRSIRGFRRDSGRSGALVVRGMPIESATLAATPQAEGSAQRHATLAAAGLLLVACGLGGPVRSKRRNPVHRCRTSYLFVAMRDFRATSVPRR